MIENFPSALQLSEWTLIVINYYDYCYWWRWNSFTTSIICKSTRNVCRSRICNFSVGRVLSVLSIYNYTSASCDYIYKCMCLLFWCLFCWLCPPLGFYFIDRVSESSSTCLCTNHTLFNVTILLEKRLEDTRTWLSWVYTLSIYPSITTSTP